VLATGLGGAYRYLFYSTVVETNVKWIKGVSVTDFHPLIVVDSIKTEVKRM
jgi:hypothetical protein